MISAFHNKINGSIGKKNKQKKTVHVVIYHHTRQQQKCVILVICIFLDKHAFI